MMFILCFFCSVLVLFQLLVPLEPSHVPMGFVSVTLATLDQIVVSVLLATSEIPQMDSAKVK